MEEGPMSYNPEKLLELKMLIDRHADRDKQTNETAVQGLNLFNTGIPQNKTRPVLYQPGIFIGVQGEKSMNINRDHYDYNPGNYLILFIPMTIDCMVIKASAEKPFMGTHLAFEQGRIARMLMKLDRTGYRAPVPDKDAEVSGIYTSGVNDRLLGAFIRLIGTLDDPVEAAVMSDSIIEEIYFQILYSEQGGILQNLLNQNGLIRQISKAVDYVYQNIDQSISVEELAETVHMGSSNFHRKFKEIMHLSPLQYMKKIKLNTAQTLLSEGRSVSEAGYLVGYRSPSQFSREYKRFFGNAPSGE